MLSLFFKKVILVSTFLLNLNFIIAICVYTPSSIQVNSGDAFLGDFSSNSNIYIKNNLAENPLKIEFRFENDEDSCFTSEEQIKFNLLPSGATIVSNSLQTSLNSETNLYVTTADFLFSFDSTIPSSFTSTYFIESLSGEMNVGNLFFSISSQPPSITFSKSPTSDILGPDSTVRINYQISDSSSGLRVAFINSERISFEGNSSYSGVIEQQISSSTDFVISATNMLGFTTEETISFEVDNNAPVISNFLRTSSYNNGKYFVSFTIDVIDSAFETRSIGEVFGNFEQLDERYSSQIRGDCNKVSIDTYRCSWRNLETNFEETTTAVVSFSALDDVGNRAELTRSEVVNIDNEPPVIKKFHMTNELGVKNFFSADSREVLVVLEVEDDSLAESSSNRLTVFENFDRLPLITPICSKVNNLVSCVYNLTPYLNLFEDETDNSFLFRIRVEDIYENSIESSINVSIDNIKPQVSLIEIIETQSIKDEVISSGENINFRVFVEEKNIFFENRNFLKGDFSTIDFRSGMDEMTPTCNQFNQTHYRCDFNGIVVENGYFLRNITFYINDIAGNQIIEKKEVEVLRVGDEVMSSYRIKPINILNPINRNAILRSGGVSAWFEGQLENVDSDQSIRIVNFQLQSCEERGLNPIRVVDFSMFPQEVIFAREGERNMPFTIQVNLGDHMNANDLNNKVMNCTISVLKRDDEQLYPPELVTFDLNFQFFDLPRGSLVEAHAETLLTLIDEAEFVGGWFDDLYETYRFLDDVCRTVGSAGSTLNLVKEILNIVQSKAVVCDTISGGTCTGPLRSATESASGGIMGSLSGYTSIVKKMCDWVTCRNGGTLMQMGDPTKDIPLLGELMRFNNVVTSNVCQFTGGFFALPEEGLNRFTDTIIDSGQERGNVGGDS